jgi:hypothetical protein
LELGEIKSDVRKTLRDHYLVPDAPSVFDQFGSLSISRIEPNAFLLSWRNLGDHAESDQKEYLRKLFARRPGDLDKFLALFFRVDFIDDYDALRSLIDYNELMQLIIANEAILNPDKVEKFRKRYTTENPGLA